ncbi:DUF485 domain-containing protein [Kitasatospora sp. NPDC094028]
MPQQQTSSPGQGQRFDWWAAPAAASASDPSAAHRRTAVPAQQPPARPAAPARPAPAEPPAVPLPAAPLSPPSSAPSSVPLPASGPVPAQVPAPARVVGPAPAAAAGPDSAEVYRTVQASAAFQDIRRGYRTFVFPVSGAFLGWYLLYVAAQAAAPGLMRTEVAGPLNVAWLLGLLQFATTFLLTWLYARNARTKRDRAALGLRWDTQDQLR